MLDQWQQCDLVSPQFFLLSSGPALFSAEKQSTSSLSFSANPALPTGQRTARASTVRNLEGKRNIRLTVAASPLEQAAQFPSRLPNRVHISALFQ
jgi:hypothetical protein